MAEYVVLGRFTRQGIGTIGESPKRIEAAGKLLKKRGTSLQKLAAALLEIGAQRNSSTETMRAFCEGDYRNIVKSVG